MKTIITTKNFSASDHLKETLEKKLSKLDKYFSDNVEAKIVLAPAKGETKLEATIRAAGSIFRAEEHSRDPYESIDHIVDKLSAQISKYKTRLQKKNKGQTDISFEDIPELPDFQVKENKIVRTKTIELEPMTVDEAIMQMDLVQHDFFVFKDGEDGSVKIVYRRLNDDFGVLETK